MKPPQTPPPKEKPVTQGNQFSKKSAARFRKVSKAEDKIDAYCRALKDGRKDYTKAFEIATAMVENYWQLGNELRRMSEAGALHNGTPSNKSYQGVKLSDLGVSKKLSSRVQELAEETKAELHEGIEKAFDDQTCKLPTLCGVLTAAIERSRRRDQLSFSIHILGHLDRCLMWVVGDWILIGENGGYVERGKHEEACEQFGIAYSTSNDAAVTCRALSQSMRRPTLSYSVHREVANRDDADELLDWCEETKATRKELREEKKRRAKRLRTEDAKKWTQARVGAVLGVARQTVSLWFISNASDGKANTTTPDARVKINFGDATYGDQSGATSIKRPWICSAGSAAP